MWLQVFLYSSLVMCLLSALKDNGLLYTAELLGTVFCQRDFSSISVAPRRHWCPVIIFGGFATPVFPLFSKLNRPKIQEAMTLFDVKGKTGGLNFR